MSETTDTGRLRRGLAVPVTVLAIVATGIVALGTGAYFTDSQARDGNGFTSGTVRLGANPVSSSLSMSNMAPGDKVVREVAVANSGSLGVRYDVDSLLVDDDADPANDGDEAALITVVWDKNVAPCDTSEQPSTILHQGALGSYGSSLSWFFDRSLAPGDTDTLCVSVTFPSSADNTAQDKRWVANVTFTARQVTSGLL